MTTIPDDLAAFSRMACLVSRRHVRSQQIRSALAKEFPDDLPV
jgi:hypothetical protein